jgi:two-component sensor histidine kinase
MTNKPPFYVHIIGCLLFLLLPILFSSNSVFSKETYLSPMTWRDVVTYSLFIVFFYVNFYLFITKFYFSRRYLEYLILLVLIGGLITWLPNFIFEKQIELYKAKIFSTHSARNLHKNVFVDLNRNIFLFACLIFASLAMRINGKLEESLQEKVTSELAYLKAQINPHFLFNSLNSIYSLAIVKSDRTATAIVKLSSMMRYIISEAAEMFVPLERELIYINSYIELQKIRLDDTAIVNYDFSGDMDNKVIAPLVLLPFLENAFKHGVNPEAASQIEIQISLSEDYLYMHVFNLKVPHINNPEHRTGFGLENSKKQLQLLYPNRHELSIDDKEHSFAVNLKIQLT